MAVGNIIERLGRAIFEAPFGGQKLSNDSPELAEIRIAVLDAVKEKAHRAGGRMVFPYNLIRIHLMGVPADQAPVFRSAFLSSYFAEELRQNLSRSSYRFPSDLAVDVATVETMPGPEESWLRVETFIEEATPEPLALIAPVARFVVTAGAAEPAELNLDRKWVNIGRTKDAVQSGGPTRHNDIAFAETDRIGQSVSRQHAHVERDEKTGQYRLFNDRVYKGADQCGLYLVRAGVSNAVHRGGHGSVLQNGDEIHLGQAVVRFEISQ